MDKFDPLICKDKCDKDLAAAQRQSQVKTDGGRRRFMCFIFNLDVPFYEYWRRAVCANIYV